MIHDTNLNAALIARQLSRLGDVNESYSYWTFGDVFEELGVPFSPFHGGFGLVAEGGIPKPTFWTFAFFKDLKRGKGTCVYKDDNVVILRCGENGYQGVAWNTAYGKESSVKKLEISLPACESEYSICTRTFLFDRGREKTAFRSCGSGFENGSEQGRGGQTVHRIGFEKKCGGLF